MSKYYNAEDVLAIFSDEERPLNWTDSEAEIQAENDFDYYKTMVESLPAIEVSEDCISREWIYDALLEYGFTAPDMTVTKLIEEAPSVVPTEKMGKWVKVPGYATPGGDPVWVCSECGKGKHVYGIEASSYQRDVSNQQWVACPNCGAKMGGI